MSVKHFYIGGCIVLASMALYTSFTIGRIFQKVRSMEIVEYHIKIDSVVDTPLTVTIPHGVAELTWKQSKTHTRATITINEDK